GFTLIELIIVIAILAILAAILVPSMIGYQREARTAVAQANARTVYSAAAAAEAFMQTRGGAAAAIALTEISTAYVDPLPASPSFAQYVANLLGQNFNGFITVTVDTTDNHITGTTWQETDTSTTIGTYTP
ncbi:MAG TPA: hypothetical protein DEB31_04725, partial [Clostridiales bacterium]|nr:hypothetical protein [Clostridiales bacterium]